MKKRQTVASYLCTYFGEDDSVFVYEVGEDPIDIIVDGRLNIKVNNYNEVCNIFTKGVTTSDKLRAVLNKHDIDFVSTECLPVYKCRTLNKNCIVQHIESGELFYFTNLKELNAQHTR